MLLALLQQLAIEPGSEHDNFSTDFLGAF